MLARFSILLPYSISVPDGEEFGIRVYEDAGYRVFVYPPVRSGRVKSLDAPDEIKLNDRLAFEAEVLRIDFQKDSFNRAAGGPIDPPEQAIVRAIQSFHARLRYVTRAYHAKAPNFPMCSWRIDYLNDDGSELEQNGSLVRGKGAQQFSWSIVGMDRVVWDNIHTLAPHFDPPVWDELRLNALAALPSIGAAVVLAATSLEVFISQILDQLAARGNVPEEIWSWINDRGEWLREPTVEEQFDRLLRFFTNHSLKEEPALWEAFKNLKTARNSFVHEGVPKVGNIPLTLSEATRLVHRTNEVISKIRQWLPDDIRWPEFDNNLRVTFGKAILKGEPSDKTVPSTPDGGAVEAKSQSLSENALRPAEPIQKRRWFQFNLLELTIVLAFIGFLAWLVIHS